MEAVTTDFQFKAVAEMFLDVIESSKELEEAKERIKKIIKNASKKTSDSEE